MMKHQLPNTATGAYSYYYLNTQTVADAHYQMFPGRDGVFNSLQFALRAPGVIKNATVSAENIDYEICTHEYNFRNNSIISISAGEQYGSTNIDASIFSDIIQVIALLGVFRNGEFKGSGICRFFEAKISKGTAVLHDFVPVLDADSTPCLYDKISKQRLYNIGTGTFGYRIKTSGEAIAPFARRDPYYTPPSGVYARPAGENKLEILADTDIGFDAAEQAGYTWHPNTGDAFTAYDINPSPEITA